MSIWWVNMGDRFKAQREAHALWCPKLAGEGGAIQTSYERNRARHREALSWARKEISRGVIHRSSELEIH